jgi:ribonuclease E
MSEVEKTLKLALKADKARVTVGKISQFGMLEMSRQRIKQNLDQASVLACPHCEGRGKVKSVENMAISFLRKVHASAAKGTVAEVRGALPLEVAYFLLNRKKRELVRIETDYEIEVTVKGKPSFLMNQLELEMIRREKPLHLEAVPEETVEATAEATEPTPSPEVKHEAAAPAAEGAEIKKKKRRRKKKAKGEVEQPAGVEAAATAAERPGGEPFPDEESEEAGPVAAEGEEAGVVDGLKPAEHKKKRRRRRRRGKGGAGEGEGSSEAARVHEPGTEVLAASEAEPLPEPEAEPAPAPVLGPEPAPEPEQKKAELPESPDAEPVKKPRKKPAPRKKKAPADEAKEIVEKPSE